MTALARELGEVATAGRLLVISDYDGVIAPIVADPAAAYPDPAARDALVELAELPDTPVAVLSGRARSSVVELLGDLPGVAIIGSHGAETADGVDISPEQARLLERIDEALTGIAGGATGTLVEAKPTSVALHVRNAAADVRPVLLGAVRSGPSAWPGVRTVEGKQVIELLVTSTDKGGAVEELRSRFTPDRTVVLGDDVTDEDAFAVLGDADLGIKVGVGATAARSQVEDQHEVAMVFRELARARRRALDPGPEPDRPG